MALPAGTTWLDVATLVIALIGLAIAVLNLPHTVRRDRAAVQPKLRLTVTNDVDNAGEHTIGGRAPEAQLRLVNAGQTTVTIESVGLAINKTESPEPFAHFRRINHRSTLGGALRTSDPPLPRTINPGEAPTSWARLCT